MNVIFTTEAKSASIEVRVIRASGKVEDLGVVSYWHKNPLKRLLWRLFKISLP